MTENMPLRKSTFALLGLPNEFGTLLLALALILSLSPYLSGADLGIFKVPSLEPATKSLLRVLGPVVLILAVGLFVPIWPGPSKPGARRVEELIGQLKRGNERRRRGAALALGKLGPVVEVAVPELIEALNDPDLYVRENAAEALESAGPAAVRHLVAVLRHEKGLGLIAETPMIPRPVPRLWEVVVESDVRAALVGIGSAAVPALMDAFQHAAPTEKAPIASALKQIRNHELDEVIASAVSNEDDDIQLSGAIALAESASEADIPAVSALLKHNDRRIRVIGIAGLGGTRSDKALASLIDVLHQEEDRLVRCEAVRALKQLAEHTRDAVPPLVGAIKDPSLLVQLAAVMALGEIGPRAVPGVPELVRALSHADQSMRKHAAIALGNIGVDDARSGLTEALKDQDAQVREAAAEALRRIQRNV